MWDASLVTVGTRWQDFAHCLIYRLPAGSSSPVPAAGTLRLCRAAASLCPPAGAVRGGGGRCRAAGGGQRGPAPLGGTDGSRTAPPYLRRGPARPGPAQPRQTERGSGSPPRLPPPSVANEGNGRGREAQIILKERQKMTAGSRHEAGFVRPLWQ